LDILSRCGDIGNQSRTLQKIDRNFACFWPQYFLWERLPNFWTLLGDSSQIAIIWQSFAAIGRGTLEIWLPKKEKKNITGKTSPSGTTVPGGLQMKAYQNILVFIQSWMNRLSHTPGHP